MQKTQQINLSNESDLCLSDEDNPIQKNSSFRKSQPSSLVYLDDHSDFNNDIQLDLIDFQDVQQQKNQSGPLGVKLQEEEIYENSFESFNFNESGSDLPSEQLKSDDLSLLQACQDRKKKKINKSNSTNLSKQKKQVKKKELLKTQNRVGRKRNNHIKRKIRTTISEEKIKILQHLFPFIINKIPYKGMNVTLKDITKIVNLGYSTVLHKFKDFRRKGQVTKGILLKCQDIKRKYTKSLIIQQHIKKALNEKKFRTASELAAFISEKHKIKVNRSIISRHLNEMKRQKFGFYEKKKYIQFKMEEDQEVKVNAASLGSFSKIFFALKSENFHFHYTTVFRLYLIDGNIVSQIKDKYQNFKIINLVIIASETNLINYSISTPNELQFILTNTTTLINQSAYEALYNQLQNELEEKRMELQTDSRKVYIVYPFGNQRKELQARQNIMKKLIQQKMNVLIMPPRFQGVQFNFVHKWFKKDILDIISTISFSSFQNFKQKTIELMSSLQGSLGKYAPEMFNAVKRVQ